MTSLTTASLTHLEKAAEYFVPKSASAEERWRGRLTLWFAFAGLLIASVVTTVNAFAAPAAVPPVLATIVFLTLIGPMMRATGSVSVGAHALNVAAFAMAQSVAPRLGGLIAKTTGWFGFFVMLAVLTVGVRGALVWACLWASSLFYLASRVDRATWQPVLGAPYGYAASLSIATLSALVLSYLFESARTRAYQAVIEREGALRAQHAALAEAKARLEEQSADMRLVLDNVEQGLLTIDREARISDERSGAVGRWFGDVEAGTRFDALLARADEGAAAWFAAAWPMIADGFMPLDAILDQLPKRFARGAQTFRVEYKPIVRDGEELAKILVILTDITPLLRDERAQRDQRELAALFSQLKSDPVGLRAFVEEARRLADAVARSTDRGVLLRDVHTLKGNAALFGAFSVADVCHEVEERARDASHGLDGEDRQRVVEAVRALEEKVAPWLVERSDRLSITRGEYDAIVEAVGRGLPRERVLGRLGSWLLESVEDRLSGLADRTRALAVRLGKPPVEVAVDAAGVRVDPERWRAVWSVLVHVLRNAVDHGVEDEGERAARGKPPSPKLTLAARRDGEAVVLTVADDGRGIDWDRVAARARSLGLPTGARDDVVAALFAPGVSTREIVTETSGRGVGLSAVQHAVTELGGSVAVESEPGAGTQLRLVIPETPRPSSR